jgi:hypothetical protein
MQKEAGRAADKAGHEVGMRPVAARSQNPARSLENEVNEPKMTFSASP